MSEGKPVTPMDVETTEAPSEGGKCGCLPCKHAPKGKSHSEFMEYHDRRCTNLLCLLIYVAFMIAWAVVGSLAFKYGTPDILTHAMDSHGNICGVANSNVISITNAEGKEEQRENVFAVSSDADGKWSGGTAPFNLGQAKVGVFPRIASDIAAQFDKITNPASIKFTQICADKCPQAGDVVCNYFFLSKWKKQLGSSINPVNSTKVRTYMRVTSSVTRELALKLPYLVENACDIYKSNDDEYQMCIDSFIHCDFTPAPSTVLLGRCLPYIDTAPQITTQRCIEPLSDTTCDPANSATWNVTGSDSDFNTECLVNADDNKFYKTRYTPVAVVQKDKSVSYKLNEDGLKYCVRMEEKKLKVSEIIPQMAYLSSLTSAAGSVAQYMGDIRTAWYVVLGSGLLFPLIFSFVYTLMMRFCAGCMVWLALLLFILFAVAAGIISLLKGGTIDVAVVDSLAASAGQKAASDYSFTGTSDDHAIYYQIIGWCLLGFALIALCMCLFMRKAIQSAIHIIKTAAKALAQNFTLTLFPIITFAGIAATGAVFIVMGVLLLTAGNITEKVMTSDPNSTSSVGLAMAESYKPASLESFDTLHYMMFFDLFMFLWTTEFIQAIGIMVVGGTISHWYFATGDTGVKPDKSHHGQSHPCCCSWWIAIRFHMGSAAFGGFLIALITVIRAIFEYIDHQMKQSPQKDTCAFKAIGCMTRCCLCCLEKCIRFISKNSYIHTAIKGDAFCFAAVRSYRLIFRHLLSFGATNAITAILMIVGKIMVCVASMLVGYTWVNYSDTFSDPSKSTYVTSSLFISISVLMLAYLVAEAFFNVFQVSIDTIMMAYCLDLDAPPVGKASRGIVQENMEKMGKTGEAHPAMKSAKPGWFSSRENDHDGFIARCC